MAEREGIDMTRLRFRQRLSRRDDALQAHAAYLATARRIRRISRIAQRLQRALEFRAMLAGLAKHLVWLSLMAV